ncbi:hypothetical protein M430DRAFT_29166 [Amorphotheca resinae ATCC 22711]|uniref:Uncharacterized protein n=1 Tax=Amorphotheca resinae ATCC 22711 TaxID=857342 RepID=A0A2T3AYM9_AMORE|nr:hypothetical protein M430DRAFT_29166 [Amorphotheca resinae ATCC 22711]PSS15169.1 hypothetical protein M430DRAFT_29166 [Amorphotheca resinae ATCC 22711]
MPPHDKQNGSRPLMPTLSAAAKIASGTSLTPRVAGSVPAGGSTPSARRTTRTEHDAQAGSSREDLSTPVSAFLCNNITPRSGSRKIRVDSANSTPSGTPTGTSATVASELFRVTHDPSAHGPGLGSGGNDRDMAIKRQTVTFSTSVSEAGHLKSPGLPGSADSKFFFASDAKSVQNSKPPPQAKSSPTFFYANGESIPPPQRSGSSAPASTVGEERSQPRFFHANGAPDLQASPQLTQPRLGSTISTSSRMAPKRLSGSGTALPPRPASPSKFNQSTSSTSSQRGALSMPSPMLSRPQSGGRGHSTNSITAPRKKSFDGSSTAGSHTRSTSISSVDSKTTSRGVSSDSFEEQPPTTPLNIVTTPGRPSSPNEIPEEVEPAAEDIPSGLQSPIKAGGSIEQMNELAAKARRERKVLDLEITNSSLAAINRTLEREMRKQTAELRRYRRLSRSGRLSLATTTSVRTSTASLKSIDDIRNTPLSDMSEEELEDESEPELSEEDSLDDGTLSPDALAASDLLHRKKDEKRLELDLSKHQQLLIDSQKLNESLKRCLGWTEELINEGKKALEYNVKASDIELGGRVLISDDVEDGLPVHTTLNPIDIDTKMLQEAMSLAADETNVWRGERKDDRDSGIVLDGSQREPFSLEPPPKSRP